MEARRADVIVVGLGIMGSAAVHAVAARGLRVLGIEAGSRGHALGSSHGPTRIIRHAVEESPAYVPIVTEAFRCWHDLEEASGRTLLTLCGALRFGPADAPLLGMVRRSAAAHGLPLEELDAAEVHARFPGFRLPEDMVGLFEQHAGVVHAAAALEAFQAEAVRLGAGLRFDEPVLEWRAGEGSVEVRTGSGTYRADRLILAAGAWMGRMLPELGLPLTVQRVVNVTFDPIEPALYGPDRCPSFIGIDGDAGFYGCPPIDGQGVKIGGGQRPSDPDHVDRMVTAGDIAPLRAFLATYMPGAAGPVQSSLTCLYTETPDGHFIIDGHPDHPEVVVASPCSGHGFKHASALGPILADLAVDGATAHDIGFLRLDRDFAVDEGDEGAAAWRRTSAPAATSPAAGPSTTAPTATSPAAAPLAAIDVGTNSIHLLVARPLPGSGFETVAREKEMVRLGSGPGDMKVLQADAMDRAVVALGRFRKLAESAGATVRAVATSAVREAENKDEFLHRARQEAGVQVEVVAGTEEARLIHLGVLQAVPVFDKRLLLIDIGGGSTEFLVGEEGRVLEARSLKLGAIRLSDRFFRKEPTTAAQVKACRAYVRSYLSPVVHDVERHGFDVAVGSSGTVGSVADMVLARREQVGARPINPTITRSEVDDVVTALTRAKTVKARARIAGLTSDRSDIILGGALLLQVAMTEFDIDELVVSDFALREGLLLDTLQRRHAADLHHLDDIRTQSVVQVADLVPEEREHGEQTRRLAVALFDGTESIHGLGRDERELLEAAALLANVGLVISHSRHHLHSYYVIRNSERLTGFNEREVELIAQVARYHRKSAPKPKHGEFTALAVDDQNTVRVLAGMLRVASALDRSYSNVARDLRCTMGKAGVTVHVDVEGDAALEQYTADQRRDLLEEALGRPVSFRLHRRA